jgi:hypothetical protein
MDSTDSSWTPHRLLIDSIKTPYGLLMDSSWTPHGLHGLLMDSTWTPHRLLIDSIKTLHGVHKESMEFRWTFAFNSTIVNTYFSVKCFTPLHN